MSRPLSIGTFVHNTRPECLSQYFPTCKRGSTTVLVNGFFSTYPFAKSDACGSKDVRRALDSIT